MTEHFLQWILCNYKSEQFVFIPSRFVVSRSNPSLSATTSLLICFIPASWDNRAVLANDVTLHFCFQSRFKRPCRLESDVMIPLDWFMCKQKTDGGGDVPDECSLVASRGDAVIRECLSNYDNIQCQPCWWKHTWGIRYMLFIPDECTVA